MTINEIRRANARHLAKRIGGDKQFADRMDMEASQVSQLIGKNPVKNIGNTIARRIEDKFQMPAGWLDVQHTDRDVGEVASNSKLTSVVSDPYVVDGRVVNELVTLFLEATPESRELIMDMAMAAKKLPRQSKLKAGGSAD